MHLLYPKAYYLQSSFQTQYLDYDDNLLRVKNRPYSCCNLSVFPTTPYFQRLLSTIAKSHALFPNKCECWRIMQNWTKTHRFASTTLGVPISIIIATKILLKRKALPMSQATNNTQIQY